METPLVSRLSEDSSLRYKFNRFFEYFIRCSNGVDYPEEGYRVCVRLGGNCSSAVELANYLKMPEKLRQSEGGVAKYRCGIMLYTCREVEENGFKTTAKR